MSRFGKWLVLCLCIMMMSLVSDYAFAEDGYAWILINQEFTSSTTGPFEVEQPARIGIWAPPQGTISSFANLGQQQLEYISQGPPRIKDKSRRNMHALYSWNTPPQMIYPHEEVSVQINSEVMAAATGDYAGGLSVGVTYRPVKANGRNSEFLAPNNLGYNLAVLGDGVSVEGRHFYHLDDLTSEFRFDWFGENVRGPLAIDIVFNIASFHYRERYVYDWLPVDNDKYDFSETTWPGNSQAIEPKMSNFLGSYAWAEQAIYLPNDPITVVYRDLPGNVKDWITVVSVDTPDDHYREFYYTQGSQTGELTFDGLSVGEYEVRTYFDWPSGGYVVQDRSAFIVTHLANQEVNLARTKQNSYRAGESILVSFNGLSGSDTDWIAISKRGSVDKSYVHYRYTRGNIKGEIAFPKLGAGEYEVRVFFDWPRGGYTVQSRYPFVVHP